MKLIETWDDLTAARDSVTNGTIFAVGFDTEFGCVVRLRRHGNDVISEVLEAADDDKWTPVDSALDADGVLGVIDIRDINTDVNFYVVK